MEDHTSAATVPQPPFNFIDFPISDLFRDHYASEGLTYPSGRRMSGPAGSMAFVARAAHEDLPETTQHPALAQAITELTAELRYWRLAAVTTQGLTEKRGLDVDPR